MADLEPLRSEVFQLNYQKVEAFLSVFGLSSSGAGAGHQGATAASPSSGAGAGGGGNAQQNRVLSKRGSAIIDARTNQLFVTDIPSKLDDIRKLILKVDVPSRQVLIEARLVEANDGFSRNLGAKLGFTDMRNVRGGDAGYQVSGNERVAVGGNFLGIGQVTGQTPDTGNAWSNSQMVNLPAAAISGVPAATLAASLFSAAANRFLNLELSALEADGKGKIISSPRVVTEDKHVAVIEQGVELPYLEASSSGSTSITFKKANLRLEVTPQITPDGNVVLEVNVAKDSKGDLTPAGFAINTQHVQTKVMVENGGTVVLGGIYQQTETNNVSKVPLLGDLPVVGYLFKTTARQNSKTELLVFITPKIIAERVSTR
jgi:type IV pilus assembly protein PilQ